MCIPPPPPDLNCDDIVHQYSLSNQSGRGFAPRLELQLQQQIATVFGSFHGGKWFRCSMVAQSVRGPSDPESNPASGIKVSGGSNREMLFLTAEQVSRLAHHAEIERPGAGTLVVVLAYSGLRWGEAVGLRRSRCDLMRSRLLIKDTVSEVNGKLYFGSTKTHEDRVIVLPRLITDQLVEHLAERVPEESDALVFANRVGNPLRNSNFRHRVWQPACQAAGMPKGLRIHDMRHTAASLAVSAGANLKAVQRLLGHASATMTLDRYSHLFTDDLEALADRLQNTLSEANASYPRPEGDDNVVELSA